MVISGVAQGQSHVIHCNPRMMRDRVSTFRGRLHVVDHLLPHTNVVYAATHVYIPSPSAAFSSAKRLAAMECAFGITGASIRSLRCIALEIDGILCTGDHN